MLNKIRDNAGARNKFKRVGRGIGSGKGKTCGRGYKGQKSRTGVALAGFEGGQMPLYRRLPKRGFHSLNKINYKIINFSQLEELAANKVIDPKKNITIQTLREIGFLKGHKAQIKLLGQGELKTKFNIEVHATSKSAEAEFNKVGGKIKLVPLVCALSEEDKVAKKNIKQ